MKGKIDKDGWLLIQRGNLMVQQICCYGAPDEDGVYPECTHKCPQFGEPEPPINRRVALQICQKRVLKFHEFRDEREQEE